MMTRTPCSCNDDTRPHPYHPLQDLSGVNATYPHVLPPLTTPHFYVGYDLNDLQLSPAPRDDELSHLRLMNTSYSPVPVGIETLDHTPIDYGDLGFLRSSELRYPLAWGPFRTSPNLLPSPIHGFPPPPPPLHHSALDPVPYYNFTFSQSSLPAGHVQVSPPLQAASSYHASSIPLQNSTPPSHLPLNHTSSKPGAKTLGASYPCQWTEGGVTCNVMVQATRPHMNRHLHEHHEFGGSDTRQMSCHWAGCGETMQQGSIARHTVTCHFQAKVTCPMCSKKLSRQDVISKHQRICPAASTRR
ncbi:hypothetical protein JVU11DRAFT_2451 [Chiua virens]|nr:hypothetical protein JVU11DRAFT_2451 [Chiua virens]